MNSKKWPARLLSVLFLAVLCSCSDDQSEPVTVIDQGIWRGSVQLPGGELPFQMEISNVTESSVSAVVINGDERIAVPEFVVDDKNIQIAFPAFNTRLTGVLDADGISGELVLIKRHGKEQHMPLRLEPGTSHRFFEKKPVANADFSGIWEVEFVEDDGTTYPAVADFNQRGSSVAGTFRTPTGDYRFLAGDVADRTLYLSTFDGAHAFLFTAKMNDDGEIEGEFWSGTAWHETWSGFRNANARLPDPNDLTRVTTTDEVFVVEFPDTSGNLIRSDAADFQDKIVIVALAGSWCPNCHDEAAFLAPFYRKYRDQGLEVIGLMYEHLDEFEEAATQVREFRKKFDIEYTLLVAGSSDKSKASETLPMLNRVIAYPTMIILDRDGEVRRVHTGFNGPGTGAVYDEFVVEFTSYMEKLLEEERG